MKKTPHPKEEKKTTTLATNFIRIIKKNPKYKNFKKIKIKKKLFLKMKTFLQKIIKKNSKSH